MDSLLCRALSFSSSSSGKTNDSKNVVNFEEFVIEDFNKAIDNWELPKTDMSRANTVIPKPIQWKDINLPDEWILEGATAPVIPKQLEPNTELQNVTQYSDGKQLTMIESQFQKSTIAVSPVSSKSDSDKKLKEPIFKPFQVSKTSQKLVQESKSDFVKAIRDQLDRIEASYSSSKVQIAPDSAQSSKIGVLEHDNVSIASLDIEAFKEEPSAPKANKIHWELALPTVKTPPDLAIDNRPSALNQSRFNASSVYEWNIDGDPSHLRDKNAELLHNLRCRKLSEFQSYKTTFFTRLFLRDDANHITWKEKFLAGLPTLLREKVRNSIKALYDNCIPYDELTYGELVSFVNKEGLKICQDLKLQKRLKWELKKSKQELCSFCKQFNYDPFKTSTSKDCNGKCSTKPYKKHYKSRSHRKPFQDFREPSYKKPSRPYKKPNFSKKKEFRAKLKTSFNYKEATCYKCGKKGHTAKFCRMNRKLHELGLDEETLSKAASLLIESSDSESSMTGDSEPLQVDELNDSESVSLSDSDTSNSDSYLKKINVLTKDQEIFLVKHISDPNLQKEYLDKLLKTLDSNKAETSKNIPCLFLANPALPKIVETDASDLGYRGFLPPTIKAVKAQETFLTQKSKAQSLLASAKSEEEYFKVMEQLLTSRSKSSVADSSDDDDQDEEPFISLGDENEDDCFGIFSPVKHCK
ncbi:hypothetical protein KPL71_006740 [Citrus sinensis]|uniref:Uncharacterized protein n=1 Tax=Citrus sinensis TaxID=2711 RepID=A0ACB8LTE6_CITSI|nr:hypothetical protein KPL71_006740 [Citrus sinensis]